MPASPFGSEINRFAYLVEGEGLSINGRAVPAKSYVELDAGIPCLSLLINISCETYIKFMAR